MAIQLKLGRRFKGVEGSKPARLVELAPDWCVFKFANGRRIKKTKSELVDSRLVV